MVRDDEVDKSPHKASLRGALAGTTGSSLKEAAFGLFGGLAYGMISPIVGHPFDTVKTIMQAKTVYKNATFSDTVRGIIRNEGIRGFYRGFLPPLVGSTLYRGAAFSAYSGTYSACSKIPALQQSIPWTGNLRPCVLIGALVSSIVRATIEAPFHFVKLRYQLGKGVMKDASIHNDSSQSSMKMPVQSFRHLYHGYYATLMRTMGLLFPFFIQIDYSTRYIPDIVNAPMIGPFFKGGICSTAAWAFAFPFETAKSIIQADTTGRYKYVKGGTWKVLKGLYAEGGVRRLYRGFGAGAGRSFMANGASMVAYSWFQDSVRNG